MNVVDVDGFERAHPQPAHCAYASVKCELDPQLVAQYRKEHPGKIEAKCVAKKCTAVETK